MIISPKFRGFICTAAHPDGCQRMVDKQIDYIQSQGVLNGPKRVLVIGASTGYGLASRLVSTFGCQAATIGVFFEKPASAKRTGSAGWYNSAAFEKRAQEAGLYATSVNGDAYSSDVKAHTADLIEKDLGQVDCIIYSLAAPRRQHPDTGTVFQSTLKPIGTTYANKTVDPMTGEVKDITLTPADDAEIESTIEVMGGDDWQRWIDYLLSRKLIARGAQTIAYSYVGPSLTHPIYKDGTIGRAKDHLHQTAHTLNNTLQPIGGSAVISVNKALVTQASAAIPVVPLYMSILFKLMKENGTHEGCIEQIYRLFKDHLYAATPAARDTEGRIRIDDLEMAPEIQAQITKTWSDITTENLHELSDFAGYQSEFRQLFGFDQADVDYSKDVDVDLTIPSLCVEEA